MTTPQGVAITIADVDVAMRRASPIRPRREKPLPTLAPTGGPIPDSIPAPIEKALARKAFSPVCIADLQGSAEPSWVWPHYIARGGATLLTGLWKAGKTTLIGSLLRDLEQGGGLVPEPMDAPVVVLSEEGSGHWVARREKLGLRRTLVQCRPMRARPSVSEWVRFIDEVADGVRKDGYGLVIIDTLPSCWSVIDENDAPQVIAALKPLDAIRDSGAGLLLLHHPRKGDATEGQAARGSGALPGWVDILTELRRYDASNAHDRRRVLTCYSRYDGAPPEVVLELGDTGYSIIGEKGVVRGADRLGVLLGILPTEGAGLTVDEIVERWTDAPKPGKRTVGDDLLRARDERRVVRTGTGRKNDPYRWTVNPGFVSGGVHVLGAGIESANVDGPGVPEWAVPAEEKI